MNDLGELLYRYAGPVVLEKIRLIRVYSISLTSTPDNAPSAVPDTETTSTIDGGVSVSMALKEQFGLEPKPSQGLSRF